MINNVNTFGQSEQAPTSVPLQQDQISVSAALQEQNSWSDPLLQEQGPAPASPEQSATAPTVRDEPSPVWSKSKFVV